MLCRHCSDLTLDQCVRDLFNTEAFLKFGDAHSGIRFGCQCALDAVHRI